MSFPNAETIEKRIVYLKQLVKRREQALQDKPKGLLKARLRRGCSYYYEYSPDGESWRYLQLQDQSDMNLAKALAQGDYNERIVKAALDEIKILQKVKRFYDKGCPEDIYGRMSPARQALITPVRLTDEMYARRWQEHPYQRKKIDPEAPDTMETTRGEIVRSKSEVFIANALYVCGIPYRVEYPITLTDHVTGKEYTSHPDFEVLDIKTRKVYLWEHFGKMDDPGYATDNLGKLTDYGNAGYHLGENMILTYETQRDPLTPERVSQVIHHYLPYH